MSVDRVNDPRPQADARQEFTEFGEAIVAQRSTILHIEGHHGVQPLRDTVSAIGGGDPTSATASAAGGEIELASGTDADDSIKLETNQSGEYAASRQAQAALYLRRVGALTHDQAIRWGYFNRDNGLLFEEAAAGTDIVVRKGGVDRRLADIDDAAIWDGPVEIGEIPRTQARVYSVDFAWYGAGPVRFGYETPVSDDPRAPLPKSQLFRQYDPRQDPALPDATSGQYMDTPNLPLRVEIDNGAQAPDNDVSVFVGGRQFSTFGDRVVTRRALAQKFTGTVGTTESDVLAIRPRATFSGRQNGVNTRIQSVEVNAAADIDVTCRVGGDVSGTWTAHDYPADESSVEIATNPTVATDGLRVQPRTYEPASGTGSNVDAGVLGEVLQPLGTEQPFTVALEASAADTAYDLIINWTESF